MPSFFPKIPIEINPMEPACEINPNQIRTVIDVFLTDLLKDPGNNQKIKPKY